MVRWLCLLVGLAVLALGIRGGQLNRTPRALALKAAVVGAGPSHPDYVRLVAEPDAARKRYSIVPNRDISKVPERLSRYSLAGGYPLLAADALPVEQWASLLGAHVVAEAPLRGDPLVLSRSISPVLNGQSLGTEFINRRLLARLQTGRNVWVLSSEHHTKLELSLFHDPEQPGPLPEEDEWIHRGAYKGVLYRLREYPFEGAALEEIRSRYQNPEAGAGDSLDEAWLIDTGQNVAVTGPGWYVYAPLRNTEGRVWVQFPLSDDTPLTWDQRSLSGIWMPAGSHAFRPEGAHGDVALLRCGPDDISAFLQARWLRHWGLACQVAGSLLSALALVLFVLRLVDQIQARRSLPEYLVPFEKYLVHEAVWASRLRRVVGLGLILVGLGASLVFIVANDALRSHHSHNDHEAFLLAVGMRIAVVVMAVAYLLGSRCLARGAAVRLRGDGRRPLLYLRSFAADTGFVDRWTDLLTLVFLTGGYDTEERALARAVADVGPLIAIGKPGEALPPLGAARMYVDHEHWQHVVEALVKASRLIILRIGQTEGFWWELKHVVATCPPARVVILLPGKNRARLYESLRAHGRGILPRPLPELDELGRAVFLGFGPGWEPRPLDFDSYSFLALLRRLVSGSSAPLVREALNPSLRQLGITRKRPPLLFREWLLVSLPVLLVLGLAVLFILIASGRL